MSNEVTEEQKVGLPPVLIHERLTAAEIGERIPWHLADLQIPEAWKTSRGAGVVVGIVDTGILASHPDLNGKVIDARDFTNSRSGASDSHGHGTHVGGIVTAIEGNRLGVAGVAPDAKLLIAKGLGDDGSGSDRGIANAISWLVDRGAHAINLSLGSNRPSSSITQAVEHAIQRGVPIICASGNAGDNSVSWPANHPETISVGATDEQSRPASFTSPSSVNIAAPGVEILSTYLSGAYSVLSGTSMAAPFVSGVVALILAADRKAGKPAPSPREIMDRLEAEAIDIDKPGRDRQTGAGLVSVKRLIRDPEPPNVPPPTPDAARITIVQGGQTIVLTADGLRIES